MRPFSSYTGNTLPYLMADSESATTLDRVGRGAGGGVRSEGGRGCADAGSGVAPAGCLSACRCRVLDTCPTLQANLQPRLNQLFVRPHLRPAMP